MRVFLDTSALAKRYVQEPGSEELDALFSSYAKEVLVSTLSIAEFAAALGRKVRSADLSEEEAAVAMQEFERDWYGLFKKIALTEALAVSAASIAIQYSLKGADAVHLASALIRDIDLFVASDTELKEAAERAGIGVYDPVTDGFQGQ